ncbi:MAG: hypothetical protein Q7S16_01165 [bacterium]|nr:hypothetical protein [bacterium]
MNALHQSILAAITYFDLFDYPLTSTEVWKYLWLDRSTPSVDQKKHSVLKTPSLFAVIEELEKLEKDGRVVSGNGFYFLPGRETLIKTRNFRHVIAYRKWHRALRVVRVLRWFPFIRMIGVANTLAYDNADEGSDIDLFIVTAKGRVWTARFFIVLFLQLFGLRPNVKTRRDKICACFFVDEDHLDISNLALPGEPDVYLHYWIATLWPLYNLDGVYEKFFEANAWVQKNVPNIHAIVPNMFRRISLTRGTLVCNKGAPCSVFPESFYRRLQERRFPDAIRTRLSKDTTVVANDHVLKFHVHDRREEYRKKFIEKMSMYDAMD